MKLIVGLGNPDKKYENTRHNTGFMTVDRLAGEWTEKPKFHGQISEKDVDGEKVIFYKPSTYYNDSGIGVRSVKDFYKLDNCDILVIHDELDLPFGTVRSRIGGSDAGNNGIKSLNAHLGEDYARIRVGIGQEDRRENDINFVLSGFNKEESDNLPLVLDLADKLVQEFISGDLEHISHKI
ncbi:aminoacyl-tRNA hydrolase [Candidatus Saccharibacteria bacterium]|nr:aminoacyl-tRNA hydrolase [Candidatus Saccharibacteria bacterium]